jgi:hypothetical protein
MNALLELRKHNRGESKRLVEEDVDRPRYTIPPDTLTAFPGRVRGGTSSHTWNATALPLACGSDMAGVTWQE